LRDEVVHARREIPRRDADARRQRGPRKRLRAGVVDHHDRRATLRINGRVDVRLECQALTPVERRGVAYRRPWRVGIQDDASCDGHRRRVRAKDVAIAA
jgi:hypothetical protein